MHSDAARLRVKTWLFTVIVVLSNAFGDFFMKRGIPDTARLATPLEYIAVLFQPWVAAGVALLIVWQMSRMALLSWADLSYVLPVTSIGYVVVALLGKVMLNETISAKRWAGIALIVAGVSLVSAGTEVSTVKRAEAPR
ncbi:MAG: EamA family transporter [Acidobacteria bacterium]|nr:EamA family transporter [Acidobacteriota bacterium]